MAEPRITTPPLSPGRFVIGRSLAKNDVRQYETLKRQASERGTRVEIVDDDEFARLTGQPLPESRPWQVDSTGIHVDESGARWLLVYKSDIDPNDVSSYFTLKEKAQSLGAELAIRPDAERPSRARKVNRTLDEFLMNNSGPLDAA